MLNQPKVLPGHATMKNQLKRKKKALAYSIVNIYAPALKRIKAERDYLSETLVFAQNYTGWEARACPLCTYEDGVFIKNCQMHKDISDLRSDILNIQSQFTIMKDAFLKIKEKSVSIPVDVAERLDYIYGIVMETLAILDMEKR